MLRAAVSADPEAVRSALAERAGAPVELHETHISWVFLAGDRAYKLKKPVALAFLDYGTPAARRRMCELEVELNRRLAPRIYLGVLSVVAHGDELELVPGAAADAIDHLVEMVRFDDRDALAHRVREGSLEPRDLAAVAALLADFHRAAAVVARPAGAADAVRRELGANVDQILELAAGAARRERTLRQRTLRVAASAGLLIEARRAEIEQRAARGMVRDCHGDLRAEHVILGARPQVVDCLEFDPGLRRIDIADDLAFLIMDLWALGAEREAGELLAGYRAAGGDCGDQRLIALYAVHRALVRAKVALLSGAPEQAARLLEVAERCVWRARPPRAIVVCGVPASGKSTLAEALARSSGFTLLSSDATRKRLRGMAAAARAGLDAYTPAANAETYAELGALARAELAQQRPAIIDATFRHRADRDAFTDAYAGAAPLLFVECRVPAAVLEQRARARDAAGGGISDADVEVVLREAARWEPLDEVDAADHLLLRCDRPPEEALAGVVAALDAAPAGR